MAREERPPKESPDTYFSLWTMTDEGVRSVDALTSTIRRASAMIREAGGTCHFYLAVGGAYDMIGVARGVDDARIVQIQHAIQALGTVRTTFVKARELSLGEFGNHMGEVNRLLRLNP